MHTVGVGRIDAATYDVADAVGISPRFSMPKKLPEKLLSVREAAELAGLSVSTIRRLYRLGRLRPMRMTQSANAPIRFDPAEIAAYFAGCTRQHAPAPTARRDARAASDPAAFADETAAGRQGGGA